jgi:hypothetical protein
MMTVMTAIVGAFAAWLAAFGERAPGTSTQPVPPPVRRALPQVTQEFIAVDAPVVALQHVRVIDGTGAPASDDQRLVPTINAAAQATALRPLLAPRNYCLLDDVVPVPLPIAGITFL